MFSANKIIKCSHEECEGLKGTLMWICCDGCKRWYHFKCLGWEENKVIKEEDKFECEPCRQGEQSLEGMLKIINERLANITLVNERQYKYLEEEIALLKQDKGVKKEGEIKESVEKVEREGTKDALQVAKMPLKLVIEWAIPNFNGFPHENPNLIINRLEEVGRKNGVEEDMWVAICVSKLKGDAQKWWNNQVINNNYNDWGIFKEKFLKRFDDDIVRANLYSKLYSEKQKDEESLEEFIERKFLLFKRLSPQIDEKTIIAQIIELISPNIAIHLRINSPFENYLSFIEKAKQINQDAERIRQAHLKMNNKKEGEVICYKCKMPGHYANACVEQQSGNERGGARPRGGMTPPNP